MSVQLLREARDCIARYTADTHSWLVEPLLTRMDAAIAKEPKEPVSENLYAAINHLMAEFGASGELTRNKVHHRELADAVMSALNDVDGGVYLNEQVNGVGIRELRKAVSKGYRPSLATVLDLIDRAQASPGVVPAPQPWRTPNQKEGGK